MNNRYRVLSVGSTSRLGVAVHQEIKLVKIQRGSIEDTIPLRIPADEQLTPTRVYTNAHSPSKSGVLADIDDILGAYGIKNE